MNVNVRYLLKSDILSQLSGNIYSNILRVTAEKYWHFPKMSIQIKLLDAFCLQLFI